MSQSEGGETRWHEKGQTDGKGGTVKTMQWFGNIRRATILWVIHIDPKGPGGKQGG